MIRRKSRLGFLFLILTVCLCGAQASVWRVGMICLTDGRVVDVSLPSRLYDRNSSQFPLKTLSHEESQAFSARLLRKSQLEVEKQLNATLLKNDGVQDLKPLVTSGTPVVSTQMETLWISPSFPITLSEAITRQDPLVLGHLYQMHELDQLFIAYATAFEGFTRLRIFTLESQYGKTRMLFDKISLPQETETLLDQAVMAMAPELSGGPVGAVVFPTTASGVKISIDGVGVLSQQGYVFLNPGKYLVKAEAMGYREFQTWIQVLPNEVLNIELPLETLDQRPLLIASPQGVSSVWIQPDVRVSAPFLLLQPKVPFTYQARKEGFLPLSGHMYVNESVLTLHFEPEWMSLEVTVDRTKDAFYESLGRSLLAFGLTVALDSLSRGISATVADQVVWQPAVMAGAGVMGVSFFETVFRLFAYYRKTQYISH